MIKLKHIYFGDLEEFIETITHNSGYKVVVEVDREKTVEDRPHYNLGILTNEGMHE